VLFRQSFVKSLETYCTALATLTGTFKNKVTTVTAFWKLEYKVPF
jgi:hypothetical protein